MSCRYCHCGTDGIRVCEVCAEFQQQMAEYIRKTPSVTKASLGKMRDEIVGGKPPAKAFQPRKVTVH